MNIIKYVNAKDYNFDQTINYNTNFNLNITNDKVVYIIQTLNEVKSINKIFDNYFKYNIKSDIENYVISFINNNKLFAKEFDTYIYDLIIKLGNQSFINEENNNNKLLVNQSLILTLKGINSVLKDRLESLNLKYQGFKKKLLYKERISDIYWNKKDAFLSEHLIKDKEKSKKEYSEIKNKNQTLNELSENYYNLNEETNSKTYNNLENINLGKQNKWMQKYIPQDNSVQEDTIKMINDLSKLIITFSTKIEHHNEISQTSKIILIHYLLFIIVFNNTSEAENNAKKANNELKLANEDNSKFVYPFSIAMIVMGLLLILLDYKI